MSPLRDPSEEEIKTIMVKGNISPLAVPMESGLFFRSIIEELTNGKRDRYVTYSAKGGNGRELGRMFNDAESLGDFLRKMEFENLGVEYFCFDPAVNAYDVLSNEPKNSYDDCIVNRDLSGGKEFFPVPVVNAYDSPEDAETILPQFKEYNTDNEFADGLGIKDDMGFIEYCDCENNCKDKLNCRCFQLTLANCHKECRRNFGDENIGYNSSKLLMNDHVTVTGIFECNPYCKCNRTCWNRVVQNGSKWRFQIFRSATGWGVQTLTDIPRGSFVTTYSGLIGYDAMDLIYTGIVDLHKNDAWRYKLKLNVTQHISKAMEKTLAQRFQSRNGLNSSLLTRRSVQSHLKTRYYDPWDEARRKEGRQVGTLMNATPKVFRRVTYEQLLAKSKEKNKSRMDKTHPSNEFNLDGKDKGNLGKYFNHSCYPNLSPQYVFVDTHDFRFPCVCFFADRSIRAGDELTWNYNYSSAGDPKTNQTIVKCLCKSYNCSKKFLG